MKKFIFYFLLYISVTSGIFKSAFASDYKNDDYLSNKEIVDVFDNSYEIKSFVDDEIYQESLENKPLISADNKLLKFFVVPFFIDKLYPNEKINNDITPVLQRIYPTSKPESIEMLSSFVKFAVGIKRRYDYVVNKLEHKIQAYKIMPKDAPIIAKDGEFASIDADLQKESAEGEYKVSYQPYKYLEYDPGDTGEAVRLRDKNYEKVEESLLDEIMLAIFRFDIKGFYQAMQKIPSYNDGSREKIVDVGDGVKARILLAENDMGDDDTIYGVFDVVVPKGFYINGDYLNDNARPKFFFNENIDNKHNISEYEVYAPAPIGVVKDNVNRRILVGQVPIPVRFKRSDVKKGIHIDGKLVFQVCDVNANCKTLVSNHSLKLRKAKDETSSIHYNYVTQAFARLPRDKSRHAELGGIEFDKENNKMIVKFNTSKTFSSVSVMAEDDMGTNYINPRYIIDNNSVSAVFDIALDVNDGDITNLKNNQIAVTATFDGEEVLRDVFDENFLQKSHGQVNAGVKSLSLWLLFFFGLLLNFMPGIFNLFIKLVECMWTSKDRIKIFIRYIVATAVMWIILAMLYANSSWNVMFLNVWMGVLAIFIIVVYLMENLGYMDIALFRPIKKYFPKGYMFGFMSVILIVAFPMFLQADVMSVLLKSDDNILLCLFMIWLGMIVLPFGLLVLGKYYMFHLGGLALFNVLYNIIYLIGALWLIFSFRGFGALTVIILALTIYICLWYAYPFMIGETLKLAKSKEQEKELFFKVQRSVAKIILVIYIVCCGGLLLFKPIKADVVSVNEVIKQASILKTDDKPILVVIEGAWSPATLINRIKIHGLKKIGVDVIRLSHIGDNPLIDEWLHRYGKEYAPLNVLFTRRYANGLAIPKYLNDTNWHEVVKDFYNIAR